MPNADVLIMAAGVGARLRDGEPKQFTPLAGKPLIAHSIEKFSAMSQVHRITIVAPPNYEDRARSIVNDLSLSKVCRVITGGETRQKSVSQGIESLDETSEFVLVHDAARPCVSRRLLDRVLKALDQYDAVVPAVRVVDTLVRDTGDQLDAILDRVHVSGVQTPQAFRTDLLRRAHRRAEASGFVSSDDGSLVFAMGESVHVVGGEGGNMKVTYEEDMAIAEAILVSMTTS